MDECLYYNPDLPSFVAVHVDDMNFAAPTTLEIQQVKKNLSQHFVVTSKTTSLLGMAVTNKSEGTYLSQPFYIQKMLKKYDPTGLLQPKHVPMNPGFKLNFEDREQRAFEWLGVLMHLSRFGRWDILFVCSELSGQCSED